MPTKAKSEKVTHLSLVLVSRPLSLVPCPSSLVPRPSFLGPIFRTLSRPFLLSLVPYSLFLVPCSSPFALVPRPFISHCPQNVLDAARASPTQSPVVNRKVSHIPLLSLFLFLSLSL